MSIEKIVAEAVDNNPLKLKEAFEEEMNARIRAALEEKYAEMTEAKVVENDDEEEDEDEDEHDDDHDEEDEDDEDDDDDEEMVGEMKKLHASYNKTEMYAKMKEKYGMSKSKFEGLYAQHCK